MGPIRRQAARIGVLAALTLATGGSALAAERLVMAFACSVHDGVIALKPSAETSYRIAGTREHTIYTACSPANPDRCRNWMLHRFNVYCGGATVSWLRLVEAATQAQRSRAWVKDGRMFLQMGPLWTENGRDRPLAKRQMWHKAWRPEGDGDEAFDPTQAGARSIIGLPTGFAPVLGFSAEFIADKSPRQKLAAEVAGDRPGPAELGATLPVPGDRAPQAKAIKKDAGAAAGQVAEAKVKAVPPTQPQKPPELPAWNTVTTVTRTDIKVAAPDPAPAPKAEEKPPGAKVPEPAQVPEMAAELPVTEDTKPTEAPEMGAKPPVTKDTSVNESPLEATHSVSGISVELPPNAAPPSTPAAEEPPPRVASPSAPASPPQAAVAEAEPHAETEVPTSAITTGSLAGAEPALESGALSALTSIGLLATTLLLLTWLLTSMRGGKQRAAPADVERAVSLPWGSEEEAALLQPVRDRRAAETLDEAYRSLGVSPDAAFDAVKVIVEGLRESWHPSLANSYVDRDYHAERVRQIDAAWAVISAARKSAT